MLTQYFQMLAVGTVIKKEVDTRGFIQGGMFK